jgi:hypothetical protein
MIPGKHSDTRIKPLTLTNDHGRYIAVTPVRTLASVGECPLYVIHVFGRFFSVNFWSFHFRNPKPPCNGRFNSETAVRRFQKLSRHLDPEVV